MSPETLLQQVSRQASHKRHPLLLILMIVVALLGGACIWLSSIAHSPLPQLDGSLSVRGLAAPVSVTRDKQGVPTIEAASLPDLFFAQGYVTAQDRLFQMDMLRRAAAGDLSEVVGEIALQHDREQRILGIRAQAEKGLDLLTPEDRQQFNDYARGVNAYIDTHRNRLPLEFRLLHYSPKPWAPEDSVIVAYQMVETLSTSPRAALTREKILAKLGPELTADLYVNRYWRDHPPTEPPPDWGEPDSPTPAAAKTALLLSAPSGAVGPLPSSAAWIEPFLQPFFHKDVLPLGSNSWVVSGAHTVTGKPLLSNDMHLGHQMPNLWYEAHLRCGDFDVAGVTLPGHPYVIVGHNRKVAWGFTNMGPTVEDAYIESFNDAGQYLTPSGWKQPESRREVIHVKNHADVVLDVETTRHGPIVTELIPGETRKIALRWTLYDGVRDPFFRVDSAQNWQEFRKAFSEFDAPGQNVLYADVNGNIGYQATGKVPIRASGDGSLPVPGSDNAHEWTGYIPFEKMPSVLNPPSGILATANGRITPDKYPSSISTEWEAPWRTDRIYRVLESGKMFSAADMLALQTDVYSELDRFVADKIVYAVDHAKNPSPSARQAADILRQWNGHMDETAVAPTIVFTTRNELMRVLLEPKLGPATKDAHSAELNWESYRWKMATVWLANVLENEPGRWLPAKYPNYDELITAALEQALNKAPARLESWAWGAQNTVLIQNRVLMHLPLVGGLTGPGLNPQSGDKYTVKAVGRDSGPSERFTADLANLDASTLNVVTGESGNFLSPYYMDQWQAWYTGTTFTLPFSETAVENAATHRLLLEPK